MFDPEFVKWFATLGIGGVLAAFMFIFYRKDIQMYTDLWKNASTMLIDVIRENTQSNIKLINLIESQERNIWRKEDVEKFVNHKISEIIGGNKKS